MGFIGDGYRDVTCVLFLQVPEVRDSLLKENSGKWKKIAQYQIKHFFEPSKAVMQEQAKRYLGVTKCSGQLLSAVNSLYK